MPSVDIRVVALPVLHGTIVAVHAVVLQDEFLFRRNQSLHRCSRRRERMWLSTEEIRSALPEQRDRFFPECMPGDAVPGHTASRIQSPATRTDHHTRSLSSNTP
jgi:hypothetical protein